MYVYVWSTAGHTRPKKANLCQLVTKLSTRIEKVVVQICTIESHITCCIVC